MKKTLVYMFTTLALLLTVDGMYGFPATPEKRPKMTVAEKKARFKKLIIPAINEVYVELTTKYQDTRAEIQVDPASEKLAAMRKRYRVQDNQALLIALKPHPRSIAIGQAVMESSWATSRFFREGNNVFGVWSFNENEPRMAAGKQRGDKTIWVKKYATISDSIRDYYRVLARGSAYKEFRALKMKTNNPYELVKKLDRYSEKGALYGKELTQIIKFNKFTEYDK